MDGNDVSKRTVMVLLVITVLVSVIGTWTVLNSMSSSAPEWSVEKPADQGQITLGVDAPTVKQPSGPVETTGNVALSVS